MGHQVQSRDNFYVKIIQTKYVGYKIEIYTPTIKLLLSLFVRYIIVNEQEVVRLNKSYWCELHKELIATQSVAPVPGSLACCSLVHFLLLTGIHFT